MMWRFLPKNTRVEQPSRKTHLLDMSVYNLQLASFCMLKITVAGLLRISTSFSGLANRFAPMQRRAATVLSASSSRLGNVEDMWKITERWTRSTGSSPETRYYYYHFLLSLQYPKRSWSDPRTRSAQSLLSLAVRRPSCLFAGNNYAYNVRQSSGHSALPAKHSGFGWSKWGT